MQRVLLAILMLAVVIVPVSAKTFKVVIHNPNGYALTDYQIRVDLSGYLSSPSNLKVTDSNGNLLKFTYEQPNGECGVNPTTVIWVKVPYIPANGDTTIYVETSSTNYAVKGDDVFVFYDDFNINSLGTKWKIYTNYGVIKITDGLLKLVQNSGNIGGQIYAKLPYDLNNGFAFEFKAMFDLAGYGRGIEIGDSREYQLGVFTPIPNCLKVHADSGKAHISIGKVENGEGTLLYKFPLPQSGIWHEYSLRVSKSGSLYVIVDGIERVTSTFTPSNTLKYIEIGNNAEPKYSGDWTDIHVDWIRVRKYADIEPTVTIEAQAPPPTSRPELSVDIQCDTIMKAGEIRTVNVIVKNIGTDTAKNVNVKVTSESLGVNVEKTFDEIPAGESRMISFRINPDTAGEYKISAVASYWDNQGNRYIETAEQTITVQPVSAPLEKKEEKGPGFEIITAVLAVTTILIARKLGR